MQVLHDQSYLAISLSRQKVTLLRKASKFGIRSANDRFGTKESVYIRKEFNSHRIGLEHEHGRHFIVLGHHYGPRDVM